MKSLSSPKVRAIFDNLTGDLKQLDMASILSSLLDTLIPFENLGVLHPYLAISSDILEVEKRMLLQVE